MSQMIVVCLYNFFKNEYCWLSVYFISFFVYVSNRTMMLHFLMMWKLRILKKSYTVSFSNLCIFDSFTQFKLIPPSLIDIEKSKCLLLTNWYVLGYFFFTPNFIWVPIIYTTNELLGFLKFFLLYYSINYKYFISHHLN